MRALRGALFLVAVVALGSLLAVRLGGAGRPGAGATGRPVTPDASGPRAGSSVPAAVVRDTGIDISVRDRNGPLLLTTRVGALDPVRDGNGFAPIDPPRWNQAVWARYRPLVPPTDTRTGTSYVYGHACHHHVCAFTSLFRVHRGGTITVTSAGRTTRYRVTGTSGDYPKSGPGSLSQLRSGVADRSVPNRIVLITCAYESGDLSLNNFVVIGTAVR